MVGGEKQDDEREAKLGAAAPFPPLEVRILGRRAPKKKKYPPLTPPHTPHIRGSRQRRQRFVTFSDASGQRPHTLDV